jgi:hypothetical protein
MKKNSEPLLRQHQDVTLSDTGTLQAARTKYAERSSGHRKKMNACVVRPLSLNCAGGTQKKKKEGGGVRSRTSRERMW